MREEGRVLYLNCFWSLHIKYISIFDTENSWKYIVDELNRSVNKIDL